MPNSPSTSFIPKQGPAKRDRQVVSRQVHFFTLVSYVLFIATLVAAAGVYFYGKHVEAQLDDSVRELNNAISGFNTADMEEVTAFNLRLKQAQQRFDKSASILSIFEALEVATVKTVSLTELNIKREDDERFELDAVIATDSFDTSLFQRGVFERNQIIDEIEVKDLSLNNETGGEGEVVPGGVSFSAVISVPMSEVPYNPQTNEVKSEAVVETETNIASTSVSEEVGEEVEVIEDNQDSL